MTTAAPAPAAPAAADTFGRRVIARLIDLLPIALLFVVTYFPSLDQLGKTDGCPTVPAPDCNIVDIETGTDANGEPAPMYIMENGRELAADHQTIDLAGTTYIADPPSTASYLLPLAYVLVVFVVLQGLLGWSPGKLVSGLRLADVNGRATGTTKAFLRWAVPDGLIGVVGVIFGIAGGPWPLAVLSVFAALPVFRWLASYLSSPIGGVNDAGLGVAVISAGVFRGHAESAPTSRDAGDTSEDGTPEERDQVPVEGLWTMPGAAAPAAAAGPAPEAPTPEPEPTALQPSLPVGPGSWSPTGVRPPEAPAEPAASPTGTGPASAAPAFPPPPDIADAAANQPTDLTGQREPAPAVHVPGQPDDVEASPPVEPPGPGTEPGIDAEAARADAVAEAAATAGAGAEHAPSAAEVAEPATSAAADAPIEHPTWAPPTDRETAAAAPASVTPDRDESDTSELPLLVDFGGSVPAPSGAPPTHAGPAGGTEPQAEHAGGAAPAAVAVAGSPYQPQWDPARHAYICWEPNSQQWLQWDDAAASWGPISQ